MVRVICRQEKWESEADGWRKGVGSRDEEIWSGLEYGF